MSDDPCVDEHVQRLRRQGAECRQSKANDLAVVGGT
jgi:AhpD family alkylhydroperoxidase